jgi:hypothetical protein
MPSTPPPTVALLAPLALPKQVEAPRLAQHWPHGAAPAPAARLALHPLPTQRNYSVVSFWEVRLPGLPAKRTTLTKRIELLATPELSGALRVSYEATELAFQQPDLSSYERVLLLLGRLYQRLELRVLPTGQLASLLNEAAVQQAWAVVKQELELRSGGSDAFTEVLAQGVEQQLARPGAVLASLRLDYLFGFLWQNVYGQRFESEFRYEQPRCFPHFFAGTDLWFSERLELLPPAAGQVALRLSGPLDASRTDLEVVHQQLNTERADAGLAASTPAQLTTLRGEYTATCHLDLATGWPVAIDASVRCYTANTYSKEYFLRLEQLPIL